MFTFPEFPERSTWKLSLFGNRDAQAHQLAKEFITVARSVYGQDALVEIGAYQALPPEAGEDTVGLAQTDRTHGGKTPGDIPQDVWKTARTIRVSVKPGGLNARKTAQWAVMDVIPSRREISYYAQGEQAERIVPRL